MAWNSSNTGAATIGASSGIAVGVGAGATNISASLGGVTSNLFPLTVIAATIETPSTPNPANGAIGVSRTTSLSWTESQAVDSMDVYFGTSTTPPLATKTTGRTYTPSGLAITTTHYWRVVAKLGALTRAR